MTPARQTLNRAMTEAQLQDAVIALARARGWRVHHDRGDYRQTIQGDPGFPDLVLARAGLVIFAELKAQGQSPSGAQQGWLRHLGWIGSPENYRLLMSPPEYVAVVWRPSDWRTIEAVLA